MRIKRLTLKNFMGVRDFTLDVPTGGNIAVFGENATGKSSLFSAFTFLLFGKDSLGKADFEIKTRNASGEVIPMIDHEVEGVFDINGSEVTLKKVYSEKWTKKRGSAEHSFDGHETNHFVDGAPKSKGEYQKFIAEIAPEELFRLLTSPTHFNEGMKWQDRRNILLEISGNIPDSAVIAAHPELKELSGLKRSIEDEKKVTLAERKKINDELTVIPARIDEATKALPGSVDISAAALMDKAKKATGELQELQQKKADIENGGRVATLRREIADIETAMITLQNKYGVAPVATEDREILKGLNTDLEKTEKEIKAFAEQSATWNGELDKCKPVSASLAERWKEAQAMVFIPGGSCPTCGQEYGENLQAVQEADFNRLKAEKKEEILAADKQNKENAAIARAAISKNETDKAEAEKERESIKTKIEAIQAVVAKKETVPTVTELPEYMELVEQKRTATASLADAKSAGTASTTGITEQITAKQAEITGYNEKITAIEMRANGEKRITELAARQKELASQFEQHEAMLFRIETFTRVKVSMLDESINSRFETVKFKLFDELINGGLAECCTCTVNGVEYGSVNNGHRIRAGAEIVNVMQKHYGVSAPVFFDNAESVTALPDMDCQVVRLVVSANDKTLRVEI